MEDKVKWKWLEKKCKKLQYTAPTITFPSEIIEFKDPIQNTSAACSTQTIRLQLLF